MKRVIVESLLVASLGIGAALLANVVSPRGLTLTRNYFPPVVHGAPVTAVAAAAPVGARIESPPVVTPAVLATAEMFALFRHPDYEQELIVFVDARDDRHFGEGHIPGAYQLDRYYPEKHLAAVLPACLNATRVVVYCTGGTCEDSHFAAQLLREAGVPAAQLAIYADGITGWSAAKLPIELGARRSGNLRETNP